MNNALLRAILETTVDGIIVTDAHGMVTMFNPACERMFGYAAAEALGADIKQLIPSQGEHDQYREDHRRIGEHLITGGLREVVGRRKSGATFPLDLSLGKVESDDEVAYVGVLRDPTERRRADEERKRAATSAELLVESERVNKTVRDVVPGFVAYWDREIRCRFANKAYADWFRGPLETIIGARMQEVEGAHLFALKEPYVRAVLAGVTQQFERALIGSDGRLAHFLANYVPDIVAGEVVGFIAQTSDVTALKETETELLKEIVGHREKNERLHEIGAALKTAQRMGRFGSWEWLVAEDVTSWSDELYQIIGRDPALAPPTLAEHSKLYVPESWSRFKETVERTLHTGEPYSLDLHYVRPDGQYGWIQARGEAARDERGNIVKLSGTAQDITERKHADELREKFIEQLTASNEEQTLFAHVASHDLREPLRMVAAFCGRLSKDYGDRLDERGREYLSLAVAATAQMTRLLDDLVDFGRVGLPAARGSKFDASQTVDRVLENFDESIRESGAKVTKDLLPLIYGNPIRFHRLMQNLIGNALKYVAEDVSPRIHVTANRDGAFWRFSVSDNGIGIEPRHYERIFEPFKRLHAKDRFQGTGLGLAICRKIVEGFGGEISVSSNEGRGSTFSFTVKIDGEENDSGRTDA